VLKENTERKFFLFISNKTSSQVRQLIWRLLASILRSISEILGMIVERTARTSLQAPVEIVFFVFMFVTKPPSDDIS